MAAVLIAFNLPKGKCLPFLFLWLGLMVCVNQKGFNIFAAAYVTFTPLVVTIYLWPKAVAISKAIWMQPFLFISASVLALALIFVSATPEHGFIRFRDRFLLSHPAGRAVNDFYYQYTLFAAEAIKSNYQKQMVSYRIDFQESANLDVKALENKLAAYDHLRLHNQPVDLTLKVHADGKMVLEDQYGTPLKGSIGEMLSAPKKILTQFSEISDRNHGLRQLLLIGLLAGLPLLIYGVLYYTLFWIFKQWLQPGLAAVGAGLLCVGVGALFWWLLWAPGSLPDQQEALVKILESGRRHERLAALEALIEQRADIATLSIYPGLITSSDIAIRYKIARALHSFPHRQSREGIDRLLKDPSPNVRCMALQAVGRRGDLDDIALLLQTIKGSDHWYVQYYAYRALKRLGWSQSVNSGAVISD